MWNQTVDENAEEVYLAGEKVLPGVYRQIGSVREICLDRKTCFLPAWMAALPAICVSIIPGRK